MKIINTGIWNVPCLLGEETLSVYLKYVSSNSNVLKLERNESGIHTGNHGFIRDFQARDVLAVELLQKDARLAASRELGKACPGGT